MRLRFFLPPTFALALGLALWGAAQAQAPAPHARPSATPIPPVVQQALRQAQVPLDAFSVRVQALDGETPRLAHRDSVPVNPASVMKLITTWAALNMLGPDHVWRTRVYTLGTVHGGTLHGDLFVQGGGDPKLVLERAQALIEQVRSAGVQHVRGDIVLDDRVFEVTPRAEAFDDEPLRPYNVAPNGLLMNFHSVIYTFTPDPLTQRAHVRSEPPLAGLQTPTSVPLGTGPCNDWRGNLQADFSQPLQPRFSGSYPASCGERAWPVAFSQPRQYAPRMLQALWQQAGGELGGQVRWGTLPAQAKPLVQHESLPLREIIADINKMSNNVMAQQLFLTLSSELGSPGRFEASRLRVSQWWRQQFPSLPEPVLDNGSGLSRQERSSAQALTTLLRQAQQGPLAEPFMQSLAVAGVDGTVQRMKERMPSSPALGRAWLKTGSLRDVASIAGYVQDPGGRLYTVVAIIHHARASQARPALDALIDWVARDAPAR